MSHTLEQFAAQCHEFIKAEPGPAGGDPRLCARIAELRADGEIVVQCLPGEAQPELPRCDRELVCRNGDWVIANAR